MSANYGDKWTSRFRSRNQLDLAIAEWSNALSGFSIEQIDKAFRKMRDKGDEWPPSLPTFLAYCRDTQSGLTHNTAAYKEFRKDRLLERKPDKEKAKSAIDKIKEMLG